MQFYKPKKSIFRMSTTKYFLVEEKSRVELMNTTKS